MDIWVTELMVFLHPFFCFSSFNSTLFAGLNHKVVLFHGVKHPLDLGALHWHHCHFSTHVLDVLPVELQRLVQTRGTDIQRKILHLSVQGGFDVSTQRHAKFDGRVVVVVHEHTDVAPV